MIHGQQFVNQFYAMYQGGRTDSRENWKPEDVNEFRRQLSLQFPHVIAGPQYGDIIQLFIPAGAHEQVAEEIREKFNFWAQHIPYTESTVSIPEVR